MASLYDLTEELNVGDKIAWTGETKMGRTDRTSPRTITDKEESDGELIVSAEGPGGGKYSYKVTENGGSKSFYHGPDGEQEENEGKVAFAELVDSDEPVLIKRGYHDSRSGRSRD